MNFNDEETKLNLKKEKKSVNVNIVPIIFLSIITIVLVGLLVFLATYNTDDTDPTKVEISLNVSDLKVKDNLTCEATNDAVKAAQNVKLTYKQSEKKYFYGDYNTLVGADGEYRTPDESEKKNGIDLVIDNLTKDIYVYVEFASDGEDCDGLTYEYDATDNGKLVLSFNAYSFTDVSVYVYAKDDNCNKLLKHFDTKLPKYNILSENKKCDSSEGKASNYCTLYTYDNFDETVLDKLEESKKNEAKIDVVSLVVVFILFIAGGVVIYIKLK